MKAPFWHGGLRKDKWESLMNAGCYVPPGIAVESTRLLLSRAMFERESSVAVKRCHSKP
jgi:hypothetical protein